MNQELSQRNAIVVEDTRRWVHRAVIGLNLCPFAKAVEVKGQVRYVISHAQRAKAMLVDLKRELQHLVETDPVQLDTTMLIAPDGFADFLEFNELLERADQLLATANPSRPVRSMGVWAAVMSPVPTSTVVKPDSLENRATAAKAASRMASRSAAVSGE